MKMAFVYVPVASDLHWMNSAGIVIEIRSLTELFVPGNITSSAALLSTKVASITIKWYVYSCRLLHNTVLILTDII